MDADDASEIGDVGESEDNGAAAQAAATTVQAPTGDKDT